MEWMDQCAAVSRLGNHYPHSTLDLMMLLREAEDYFGESLAEAMTEVALVRALERNIDPFYVLFSVRLATQ